MFRDLEHPEITCAIRTGYPSWMQEREYDEEEDEDLLDDEDEDIFFED